MFVLALSLSNYAVAPSAATLGKLVFLLVIFSSYIIIFLADLKYQLIPDLAVIPSIILVLIVTFFTVPFSDFSAHLISALLLTLFFWSLYFFTKGKGMGFGDVKLALLIGLFNSFPQNIIAIFGSFILGALFSILLMIFGRAGMKTKIAFGPFMVISSVVTLVFGRLILRWYVSRWFGV